MALLQRGCDAVGDAGRGGAAASFKEGILFFPHGAFGLAGKDRDGLGLHVMDVHEGLSPRFDPPTVEAQPPTLVLHQLVFEEIAVVPRMSASARAAECTIFPCRVIVATPH